MTRSHFDTKQIDRGLGGLYTYRWRQRKSGERKEFVPRERSIVKNKEGGGMGGEYYRPSPASYLHSPL